MSNDEGDTRWQRLRYHAKKLKTAREATVAEPTRTDIFIEIERTGATLRGCAQARLKRTKCCLKAQLDTHGTKIESARVASHGDLIEIVKKARNDRMHEGPRGRRAAEHAAELAIRLEEALMSEVAGRNGYRARDIMASPVEEAEGWQTLYEIRRMILSKGFSTLPWRTNGRWYLVTADWVAQAITEKGSQTCLDKMDPPSGERPKSIGPEDEIDRRSTGTTLVTESTGQNNETRLVGIITAVDRLAVARCRRSAPTAPGA